jgi:hypothetical protein
MPLFTLAQVQSTLTNYVKATTGTEYIEVFYNFPADEGKVSEGIYVAQTFQADRLKNSNGILPGGHVYSIKDRIEMYVISQQDNPYMENMLAIFPRFIDDPLFSTPGYYLREHVIEQQYVKNSQRYRIIFDLTRLQVI